jgi:hypothetical protein
MPILGLVIGFPAVSTAVFLSYPVNLPCLLVYYVANASAAFAILSITWVAMDVIDPIGLLLGKCVNIYIPWKSKHTDKSE